MICQNHCSLVISILTTDATGHTVVELTVARLHIRNHCGTVEVYHDGYYIGTEMFV